MIKFQEFIDQITVLNNAEDLIILLLYLQKISRKNKTTSSFKNDS